MSINSISTDREQAEIKKLIAEKRALQIRVYFDIIKSIVLILGSIILFFLVQRPESLINQRSSVETISRERAKLLLELNKENNPEKIYTGLKLIKSAYPEDDTIWFNGLLNNYRLLSNLKNINDLRSRLDDLLKERKLITDNINSNVDKKVSEKSNKGEDSGELSNRLNEIDYQIVHLQRAVSELILSSPP